MNSKKLNVMMITIHGYVEAKPVLSNIDTGGQVVYVLELSKNLAKLGCNVDIYTRRFNNKPETEQVSPGVRIVNIACGPQDFVPKEHMIRYLAEYVDNVKSFMKNNSLNYDVINSHYWDGGYAGMKLSQDLSLPHFHTAHSMGIWKKEGMKHEAPEDELDKKYNFTERIEVEKEVYKTSDILVSTTPVQEDMYAEDYDCDKNKIITTPPGFDPERFYPVSEEKLQQERKKLNLSKKYVFTLGRMASNKGYDLLLKAMKPVIDEIKDIQLLLGAGSETPNAEEKKMLQDLINLASNLGIEENVRHLYYISDEDLPLYYRCAQLFGLASRYEPFGMTAVEAMACGTPVVATTRGGLKDALEYAVDGLYADPEDTKDYADKMLMILKDDNFRRKISINAAKKAHDNFSWPMIAEKTLDAFNSKTH